MTRAAGSGVVGWTVDVCVCTFRRPSLERTLVSLADQRLPAGGFRVIVADNDDEPSARARIEALRARLPYTLLYIHAPARNISVARNACLAAATAPLIAFIDDDEEASATWLADLLDGLDRTGADALFGPVQAIYPDGSPPWLRLDDLHSTRPKVLSDGSPVTGYTSNVIVKRAVVGEKRFDPARGRSGGEDTLFFDDLKRDGRRLRFWPNAIVREPVPSERIGLTWLLRRSFRNGQTHAEVLRRSGKRRPAIGALAFAKSLYCALSACRRGLRRASGPGWRADLHRGVLHLGVLAATLGTSELQLYGPERGGSNRPS